MLFRLVAPSSCFPSVPLLLRPVSPPSRCSFVPFPLRPVSPPSRFPSVPLPLRPVAPSSRFPSVPFPLRPVVPPSRFPSVPLPLRSVPTTAANSAIRCRCGIAFRLAPCHRLSSYTSSFHLPKVCRIPVFSSHLPKVRGGVTASRAPCVRVFPAAVAFPPSEGAQISPFFISPSEGVQNSRVFVPPSEGAWSRHCFENALCPCFSCRRGIPTFRRCAEFPCFCPTFRRCADFPFFISPSEGVQFQNEKAGCALS